MLRDRKYVTVLVLLGFFTGMSGILANIASSVLPAEWKPYLWLAWPLFVAFVLASIGLAVWQIHLEQQITMATKPADTAKNLSPEQISPLLHPPEQVNRLVEFNPHEDWSEAPDIGRFYGREEELDELRKWMVTEHCRLVGILGMGGIGKTLLATKLAKQIRDQFDYVIWRSLRNAPTIEDTLAECILFLSDQREHDIPKSVDKRILLLISYLQEHRCLLLFDNVEAMLQGSEHTGRYRDGYEGYSHLFQQVGESWHQSCLILTSREKPREIVLLEGAASPVRSYQLEGLKLSEGREILKDKGLLGTDKAWEALIGYYAGNPLALKLVSEIIREVFNGDIADFLKGGGVIFGDVRDILDQQFARLSALEQKIMYWLAIEREAISPNDLEEDIVHPVPRREMLEALRSLRRRHLIEKSTTGFTLQNVVMEYMTDKLVDHICEEIRTGTISLFMSHALMKAQSKDYVRNSQMRLILTPVIQQLSMTIGQAEKERRLKSILSKLRKVHARTSGYAAGNLLNLLIQSQCDLRGYNFSQLTIRQAYLQGATLQNVNFAHADLATSVFTDSFGNILSVALSPDGEVLAAGTATGEIRLWRATDGTPLVSCQGHADWVWTVSFSPDGKVLASSSGDRTVRLWDTTTGQCLHILRGHTHWVGTVAFSPDGKTVGSGSEDHTARLWDATTGQCLRTLQEHSDRVRGVAFNFDGSVLASSSYDLTVRLWEVSTGRCFKILEGHTGPIRSVAFNLNGSILASGSEDQTIRLWDVNTGQCLHIMKGHAHWIRSVAFSPDGKIVASASDDQIVRLWEVSSGQCLKTLQGHTNWVRSVAFSPDGSTLISGSEDQTVRFWDVNTGQCLKTLQGHTNWVWSVAFSPDGSILASGDEDQIVRLWKMSTGQCFKTLRGHTHRVRSIAFNPHNGRMIASCGDDRSVRLWEVSSGECLKTLQGHINWVWSVAFSPDGSTLISGGDDQTVRLWDTNTGHCLRVFEGHTHRVGSVAFGPDGRILASGSEDKFVLLWEASTGHCLRILQGHTNQVRSVAFSPDGRILASGGDDQTVRLWEVSSGECLRTLQGHTNWIRTVAFSPDGRILASGGDDQTVRLWEVSSGECLRTLQGHTNWVWSVAFSPDGYTVASGSNDGTIKLWQVQTGTCLRMLRSDRPYENMNITSVRGLTSAQKATLLALGAIDNSSE